MTALVSHDLFSRHAVAGFAFRDASDLSLVADGLDVALRDAGRPERVARLAPTASGTWMTPRLPGLGAELPGLLDEWPAHARLFVVEVDDRLGRYLPIRFEAELPKRGRFVWPSWAGLDQPPTKPRIRPLLPEGAPDGFVVDYLPLFPSIARPAPASCATVRAHLAFRETDDTDRPAAWAMMTVTIGGRVAGLGMADADGAVAVSFPYPALPGQSVDEAAAGRSAVSWDATARVYHAALPGDPPDLSAILDQLSTPVMRALATLPPAATDLGAQPLVLGRPLTVATMRTDTERFSSLYLDPA